MGKKILYIIPARGGSKGIPYKNIKLLVGKPLIYYSIDVARKLTTDENICVSTDDIKIIKLVESYGLKVPFMRPAYLATDEATTNDVLLHAIDFYEKKGINYDIIVLLQPTSPLREASQVKEALKQYTDDLDMVVSVKESHAAAVICQENEDGFVELSLNKTGEQRQKVNTYYEYNGAIYVINIERLKEKSLSGFTRKKKYVMDEKFSLDIDQINDFYLAEFYLKE
mgnify:CR=1 FL=1|jgi:N-acylneuraminate cytidylyltransferase